MNASDVAVERGPFTYMGKEVLANGSHYADAINPHTAEFITDALNRKVPTSDETARLRAALHRQTENMAFLLNKEAVPDEWFARFNAELHEDRKVLRALQSQEPK